MVSVTIIVLGGSYGRPGLVSLGSGKRAIRCWHYRIAKAATASAEVDHETGGAPYRPLPSTPRSATPPTTRYADKHPSVGRRPARRAGPAPRSRRAYPRLDQVGSLAMTMHERPTRPAATTSFSSPPLPAGDDALGSHIRDVGGVGEFELNLPISGTSSSDHRRPRGGRGSARWLPGPGRRGAEKVAVGPSRRLRAKSTESVHRRSGRRQAGRCRPLMQDPSRLRRWHSGDHGGCTS